MEAELPKYSSYAMLNQWATVIINVKITLLLIRRVAFFVHSFLTKNKGIDVTSAYNDLNLPTVVDFGSGNRIEWSYDVTGNKLRKTVYDGGSISLTKDFVGGCEYEDGELDFIATEEGKVDRLEDESYNYVYNLKDHLGNVRLSFKDDGSGSPDIIQKDAYYPFGMRLAGLSENEGNENRYLYNGKELEDDYNLNWYHYGVRFYDPQLGRWHTVDPVDEFCSPYVYCGNDPVNFIDPDGAEATPSFERIWAIAHGDKELSDNFVINKVQIWFWLNDLEAAYMSNFSKYKLPKEISDADLKYIRDNKFDELNFKTCAYFLSATASYPWNVNNTTTVIAFVKSTVEIVASINFVEEEIAKLPNKVKKSWETIQERYFPEDYDFENVSYTQFVKDFVAGIQAYNENQKEEND